MNIKNKIKSKEKLFEVLRKLNNISINESFNMDEDVYATLTSSLEILKSGGLLNKRGGRNTSKSQKTELGYFVEIDGFDREGNEYGFKFNVEIEEGLDDSVIQVTNVDLTGLFFNSNDETEEILLDEKNLIIFNKPKNTEYFNVIKMYIDIDLESDIKTEQ